MSVLLGGALVLALESPVEGDPGVGPLLKEFHQSGIVSAVILLPVQRAPHS